MHIFTLFYLNGLFLKVNFFIRSVHTQQQQQPQTDPQIFRWVNINNNDGRRLRVWGSSSNYSDPFTGVNLTYGSFLGLPFALPPTAHLRFQRPSLRILDKEFRAFIPPPSCPQLSADGAQLLGEEDCLYLNIYMPIKSSSSSSQNRRMPVLVWFHGSSPDRTSEGRLEPLSSGSAMEIDPRPFLPGNVVIVVPQYRLGTLGG
jgi:hypothetical protein